MTPPPPRAPAPLVAIGDVHGCAAELRALLAQLPLGPDATVVFVGDYVDRGPDSRAVIDTVLALGARTTVVGLLGNHEAMLLDFLDRPASSDGGRFIFNGGSATLAAYADERGRWAIPEEHRRFLRGLALVHETPRHVFVHAGLPEAPLAALDPAAARPHLLWTRAMRDTTYDFGKVVVHGHSAVAEALIAPNRVNVDTGCVYGGRLSAVELHAGAVYSVAAGSPAPPRHLRDGASRRRAMRFAGAIPVRLAGDAGDERFETINYSPLGLYLRPRAGTAPARREGDVVHGVLGEPGRWEMPFGGRIVRRAATPAGTCLAVALDE